MEVPIIHGLLMSFPCSVKKTSVSPSLLSRRIVLLSLVTLIPPRLLTFFEVFSQCNLFRFILSVYFSMNLIDEQNGLGNGVAEIILLESEEKVITIKKGDAIALPFGVVT